MRFEISDLGFGIRDSGFGIRDSGFGARDSGLGIRGSGFGIRDLGVGSGDLHWTWLVTAAAIAGTVANVRKLRWSFGVWMATNAIWCARNLLLGETAQAFQYLVYFGLAAWGWRAWRLE